MNKSERIKTGLVLEGGAMRGMYTAAVLDVFLDQGIRFDAIAGVSAGALFGVNFLSGQKGRVIRYNKKYNRDRKYMGLLPLLKEGNIVSTEYAYHRVPEKLDPFDNETYMCSDTDFYAVLTNVKTGMPEYVKITDVFRQMDTLRASGSLPFVSRPVEIDGESYLDGGISDSIPYEFLRKKLGCSRLVVILTRDLAYRKKPSSPKLIHLLSRKMPAIEQRMLVRHETYNKAVEKLCEMEKRGEVFIIRPSEPIEIGRLEKDPSKLQAVYDLGRKDALEQIENLREYL
ncbi:MAG: patatin family protein [Lachnospiraceae bacterium]|nr:patatin family protein [Lachnospiraceae bacterium]